MSAHGISVSTVNLKLKFRVQRYQAYELVGVYCTVNRIMPVGHRKIKKISQHEN